MHIFYINLDSRPDRRAFMERQAALLGFGMERLRAVTPADIPQAELDYASRWLGQGELACSHSHRAAWRLIVERNLPAALILEDDCVLTPQAAQVLADPDLMSPGIDMLQFETHPSRGVLGRPVPTRDSTVTLRRMMSSCLGTCAYIMTARMARHCIDHPDLPKMDLGKFLFSRNGPGFLYRFRVFQAFPALATPFGELVPQEGLSKSDLDQWRDGQRAAALAKGQPRRRSRWAKLCDNAGHASRALKAFGLTELLAARHVDIPFAGTEADALALLENSPSAAE